MKTRKALFGLVVAAVLGGWILGVAQEEDTPSPLRVLLVLGGCCHDYATQQVILKEGLESRLHVEVEVEYNPDTSTGATFPIYESDDWAKDYDLVIHDECTAKVTDPGYVGRILRAHAEGTPAVNLHCAMHSYRWGDYKVPVEKGGDNAGWFEMIGLQSSGHGPKEPMAIEYTDPTHPITKGLANWETLPEELYNNIQIFESAQPLASAKQMVKPKAKKGQKVDPSVPAKEMTAVVAWTNEYGPKKTKVFSTSVGHFNETVEDPRYLDLVARGILWASGKLDSDGNVLGGYGKVAIPSSALPSE